jgi:rod shape-determining protein MreC
MVSFLARHRSFAVGSGIAAAVVALSLTVREKPGLLGSSAGLLGAPVQSLVHGVTRGLSSILDEYVLLAGAQREAERLRKEAGDLRRELLAVQEVAQENTRLRSLLGFQETTDLPMLPAQVIGRSASTWFRTVVLDKGSLDGVSRDSPVVTAEGVVGRIYQVNSSSSRVLLITDASSAIDALVQESRAPLVVEGRLGPSCRILYLARADEANAGDRVVTSGLGGTFPKGLLIGEISQVEATKAGVFQTAELRPSVDLSRLEEVFILPPGPANP